MSFDPVPWLVAGGSHSADVARLLSYYAANKTEGVAEPTDLQVQELDVPGSSVRITTGGAAIYNRTPGYSRQVYLMLSTSETEVVIAPTGSGSGRSDLVIARVEDPTLSGSPWDAPPDPTVGPYVFPRVISGVPSGTTTVEELGLGYSAIPLARIDIPASTGTITQAMIQDLRGFAGVSGGSRTQRVLRTYALVTADLEPQTATAVTGEYWPNLARWDIEIPGWATEAQIMGEWVGVLSAGNIVGRLWVGIGDVAQTDPNQVQTQEIRYDTVAGSTRWFFKAADNVAIPASMRGQTKRIGLRARRESSSPTDARVSVDWGSAIVLDIEFREKPATDQIV